MVGEVFTGLTAAKTAFDIAKGLKDIHDATIRNAAVIELQEQILAAQEAQTELIQRIGSLEKEVASFEKWEATSQRYELKNLGKISAFAYMLKPEARGTEPPHYVCTKCYGERQISIIQYRPPHDGRRSGFECPTCQTEITPSSDIFAPGYQLQWLD